MNPWLPHNRRQLRAEFCQTVGRWFLWVVLILGTVLVVAHLDAVFAEHVRLRLEMME